MAKSHASARTITSWPTATSRTMCTLGNHIIMSNVATLAGHVTVEDHAVIGGLAAVHQFCRIGKMSMIGGCSKVVQDVPPFMMADGNPAETRTINKIGLERNGVSEEAQSALQACLQNFVPRRADHLQRADEDRKRTAATAGSSASGPIRPRQRTRHQQMTQLFPKPVV